MEDGADLTIIEFTVAGAEDAAGNAMAAPEVQTIEVDVDTANATVAAVELAGAAVVDGLITDADDDEQVTLTITFSEEMAQTITPTVTTNAGTTLIPVADPALTGWTGATTYQVTYTVADAGVSLAEITVDVSEALDLAGNLMDAAIGETTGVGIDTENPTVVGDVVLNPLVITDEVNELTLEITFSEEMNTAVDGNPITVTNDALLPDGSAALTQTNAVWDTSDVDAPVYVVT